MRRPVPRSNAFPWPGSPSRKMAESRHASPDDPAIDVALREAALVLCAHGQGGSSDIASDCAAEIRRSGAFARVEGCCINGQPDVAATLGGLRQNEIYLVPLLMAAGYTYRTVLPPLIARHAPTGARVRLCPPLGEAAGLESVAVDLAVDLCTVRGWAPEGATLVVAAHGTPRSAASGATATELAAAIDRGRRIAGACAAFLEQAPLLADRLRDLRPRPCIVVGFFMDSGSHAGTDIPRIIASAHPDAAYTGAIGRSREIPKLIVEMVRAEARKTA